MFGSQSVPSSTADDQSLANLVDEVTRKLELGEPLELEAIAKQYPRYAARFRQLWPVLQTVTALPTRPCGDPASIASEHNEPTPVGPQLGDYRLVREIGRGGMGVVYEAEQLSLGRKVAVKVLMYAGMLDRRQLARFQNEVRVASRLQHQNIVPVFGVGSDRGVHYYAMQYVGGCTLADVIQQLRQIREPGNQSPPPVDRRQSNHDEQFRPASEDGETTGLTTLKRAPIDTVPLAALSTKGPADGRSYFEVIARLGIQAADALEHAHSQGVVHRDVKPANLLLEENAHLWITDFGLARMETNASLTGTGDVMGTPRYMSPEQAAGRNAAVDEHTDIYSLGATLYELLTLRPAFDNGSRQDVLRKVINDEPPRPRRLQPNVPLELETIVLKAMEKIPADRYVSAGELAADLRRFLDERPVRAKRPTVVTIAKKWCRRHRSGLLTTAILVFVLALVAAGLFARERQRIATAWSDSELHRQRAIANLRIAKQAVDDMYSEVAKDWLGEQPQLQQKQKEFLEKAARFYETLLPEADDKPEDRFEAAETKIRLGDVEFALGRRPEALKVYHAALPILAKLSHEFPGNG